MESSGLTRGPARTLAWLLVCDPPEQSAADIAAALHASTGAVSQNVRMLMQLKLVERTGYRGDRRSFYRVAPGAWNTVMVAQLAEMTHLRQIGERGLNLLAASGADRCERLVEMTDFYAFLEREMPALLKRWSKQNGTPDE